MSSDKPVPRPRASRSSVTSKAAPRTAERAPSRAQREQARFIKLAEADITSVAAIVRRLPAASDLAPGTLVILRGDVEHAPSLARSVLAVFGRKRTTPRSLRCTALVASGFVDVGAAWEDEEGVDLAWGYAPSS